MARASLILAGLLGILGVAAIGGGFLFGNFVTTSITEGIEDALVILRDEDDYADWLTNEDDGDIPRYKTYYFWNLTNAAAYLAGTDPVMEEIGPYVFRQFDRKIQVEFNADNTTVTYLTYTYYVFEAGLSADGASVDDRIININTAYLGVIAGAGSEAALVIGFVGPVVAGIVDGLVTTFSDGVIVQGESLAITTILAGLQGDFTDGVQVTGAATALATIAEGLTENFVSGVLTQALAIGLEDIQAGVTEELEFAVNATTAANLIAGNWAALSGGGATAANLAFFNDASIQADVGLSINGVAGYLTSNTTDLVYTNDSITAFLHEGVPDLGVQGWLEDLDTGMGILGYLITYEKAITNDGLNTTTMMLLYNATQAQLDGAALYLTKYLIESNQVVADTHLGSKLVSTQFAAELLFYDQWANSTSVPGGIDLIDDMIDAPSGFEVGSDFEGGAPTASNISRNTTLRLFDSSNGLALSNVTGAGTWLLAAAGNTTLQGLLTSAYLDLNLTQFGMIYAWIAGFYTNFITPATVVNFSPLGVVSTDDIGYLQFGNSFVTSGNSLLDLDPSLLLEAEFWAWSERVDSDDHILNVTNSRGLLSGSMNLTDATGVGRFLQLATTGNITGINTLFETKLEITDLLNLTRYITYLVDSFVLAALPISAWDELAYFHWGNGAVTSGLSLFDLDPTLGAYPELWAYAQNVELDIDFTLSYSNSLALLNGSTNFLTPEGVGTFLLAASNGATAVNGAFGTDLTASEVGIIATYLDYIASTFVLAVLPIPDLGDIGYFHWGSGAITSGDSLLDLDPTLLCEAGHFFPESCLPDYPEFWAWAEHVVGTPYSLTLENSKGLLTGDYYLGDAVSVGTLLQLGALGQLDTINALFETDLNTTDLTMVMGYIQYMMTDFVAAWVLAPVFAADGDLVTERTVNQWLWDYDDPLLEFLKVQLDDDSIKTANNLFTNHTDVTEAETGSPSTFMTGLDNIDEVGQYVKWRGNTTITVWNEDEVVQGTDASQFAPGVSSDDVLTAWVAELLRVVTFEYQEDAEIYNIDLLRFALADSVLASSTENPANAKYNQDLTGMANMEAAFGIPLFVSKPHFLDAESSVSAGITGLSPDAKLHDTFIDVEPTTGATMNAAKRLQISLFVDTGDFFNTDVASSFIPLVWVEEGGSITEEAARDFIEAVIDNQNLGRQVNDIGPIVGGVMLIASAAIAVRGSKPKF